MPPRDPSRHTCTFDGKDACRACASRGKPDARYRVPIYDTSPTLRAKQRARAAIGRAAHAAKRAAIRSALKGNRQHDDEDEGSQSKQ
jgi:hypothetical protein